MAAANLLLNLKNIIRVHCGCCGGLLIGFRAAFFFSFAAGPALPLLRPFPLCNLCLLLWQPRLTILICSVASSQFINVGTACRTLSRGGIVSLCIASSRVFFCLDTQNPVGNLVAITLDITLLASFSSLLSFPSSSTIPGFGGLLLPAVPSSKIPPPGVKKFLNLNPVGIGTFLFLLLIP
eukprot:jgi/Mesvir1/7198/Mv25792-RA.1